MKKAGILIVDDESMIVDSIRDLIEFGSDYEVFAATSPFDALKILDQKSVHVIISDFLMPEMNGIEFLLEAKKKVPSASLILITGYADKESALRAINEVGIYSYMEKPWDNEALLLTIKNAVERGTLLLQLQKSLRETRRAYVAAIYRLATTSEMFDDDTFSHVLRIARLSEKLAELSGEDRDFCFNIKYASMMHDVGKIGVPKEILNKKGKLSDEEFDIVKKHPLVGSLILKNPENPLMEMAREIALFHHEKYDGKGYTQGLKGETIPKSARIVAVADVFDALLSERPYKPPFPPEKVRAIFSGEKGRHFDPELSGILLDNFDLFLQIYHDTSRIETENLSDILFHIDAENRNQF